MSSLRRLVPIAQHHVGAVHRRSCFGSVHDGDSVAEKRRRVDDRAGKIGDSLIAIHRGAT